MKRILIALLALPFAHGAAFAQAPAGNAAAGKALWEGNQTACRNCHGETGQGAFGPDLAGRGLSFEQFRHAIRQPWGIMPAFVEDQINDQQIADLTAYFNGLPKNAAPGPWRFAVPAGAPPGLAMHLSLGCGQCHGPTLNGPRNNLGAVNADFDYFANLVYNHTTAMDQHRAVLGNPPGRENMGNFNRMRVSEAQLREIYYWMRDEMGFRVPLQGRLSAPMQSGNGMTYTLTVSNNGLRGKGLTAEGVMVKLILPAGANVVSASGTGYQGVRMDADAKANVAEFRVPSLAAREDQSFTITLSSAGSGDDRLRGEIRWASPAPKAMASTDVVTIAPAPAG